ncbi:signal recognition particle protein [Campylobacter sputorum subsp. bubulus]|uniref:signal-recognition-particle GTPase n=1 Tax=Campylobacter sputorum subsp. sputorum TaxID=32024 RepID=A0A381DKN1_9BACT|nr:signal recognition particle protein [Campylobacter sputorum]ASM34586.1 signal recognition particle protein [Campylobacter sputorum aubsp. sputorum RM3237]KAB0581108.1 signal recognition particle protein [Campylobacter sputorum subsp. sputorum]QEL04776.1 signal recognition particle protein [Campylobacter sputorum subsp. sputorum]SUX09725.1 signal recognition particle protein [Campylobacter sputorum subsp. bubulus]SUX11262.1 signal recognition particle protein [Campylobacter sputorum subsp. s
MFEQISDSFKAAVNKLKTIDDEKALKNAMETLKKALLKADVYHKVVKDLLSNIEKDLKGRGIGQKQFLDSIKENLTTTLTAPGNQGFVYASNPPTVVLMTGLQGSGKTTTTVKLANFLKLRKKKILVAACDLQRLAAVEQLKQLCAENEIELFNLDGENNPINVAKEAIKKAKDGLYDVLLVDTAGRLAIDEELMSELKDIKSTINPNEIFYVADSMSGQDAVRSAKGFDEILDLTGVILSKFDSDSKGGVAIGIAKQLEIPLRFVGIGEKVADLESFIPDRIVSRIMGEGDLATLVEKTSAIIDEKEAKRLNKKIKKGQFNFNDFIEQLESVKKLGNMKNLIGMIPGLSNVAGKLKDIDLEGSDEIKHIKAMIQSMTPKERENPDLLNNSRKRRLASGAGLSQMEVNKFLKQFSNASKIAKKLSNKNSMRGIESMLGGAQNFPR